MRLLLTLISITIIVSAFSQDRSYELWNLALKYTESGKQEEAIKVCNKLLATDTSNANIYYLRGVNYFLLKAYEDAINDFDKTLSLDPNFSDAYLKRAQAKKEIRNYWGAVRDYNQAKDENFAQTVTALAGDLIKSIFSGD